MTRPQSVPFQLHRGKSSSVALRQRCWRSYSQSLFFNSTATWGHQLSTFVQKAVSLNKSLFDLESFRHNQSSSLAAEDFFSFFVLSKVSSTLYIYINVLMAGTLRGDSECSFRCRENQVWVENAGLKSGFWQDTHPDSKQPPCLLGKGE